MPAPAPAAAATPPSLTTRLAAILARPVTPADRARAARHVLDWIGCAAAGANSPVGRALRAHAGRWSTGPATGFGVGRIDAHGAALLNGGLGNVLEMDDVHRTAILHPGPVVVPAALALAQDRGAEAGDFLDAVVRGYEAVIRVGRSVGPGHYRHWHNTATCGPFGAAAACASLLGLNRTRTVWALGNAGTQMSGVWQCRLEDVMTKQVHTARAAHAGLWAAELALNGVSGPADILEGRLGLYAAACPDAEPDTVVAEPEGPWLVFATSFKPWAACRHAHAAIDAALLLRDHARVADIARLTVETYPDAATFCDRPDPTSGHEAKFSLQHAVAVTLLDGPPGLDSFTPEAIIRPDVAGLRRRIQVRVVDRYAAAFPRHYGSGLSAELGDGRTLRTDVPDALGDPENPVDDDTIIAKARTLMLAGGLRQPKVDAIVERTLALADGGTLDALTEALP